MAQTSDTRVSNMLTALPNLLNLFAQRVSNNADGIENASTDIGKLRAVTYADEVDTIENYYTDVNPAESLARARWPKSESDGAALKQAIDAVVASAEWTALKAAVARLKTQ